MTPTFQAGQKVFNRDTGETGTVRKVYELNGIISYEVTIPSQRGTARASNRSDWAEGVLEVRPDAPEDPL
jgi:hypothetical protein